MTAVREISEIELRQIGEELSAAGKSWHLHVLSPDCQLNQRRFYAIFLENTHDEASYVAYSEEPMAETAKLLAKLVHGESAVQPLTDEEETAECPIVQKMVVRAKELMTTEKHWHHHIFFPKCVFNPYPGKWTMIFEDPERSEVLTSVTDEQPVKDIGITERLYYSQKT